ncbi:heme oxygenase [Comamonas testosteroni]|uniref:Heme oxygenase n=1 Tax=Comamonas testosteroni TaxID=285 RepID=A0A0L7N850_COMTE|nr:MULTISPECIES: biliverdin-producing heme oxygenase [Comamonas]KOC30205.1 heme oxygenase [Comamonas testosteroni]KWT73036.1 Heme oxygenase HemO, associated with heme uptake [Comamonas testosteroni]MDN5504475.1 biliverdin-producing heme oxygenase [Comamonas sp.]MDN5537990.1 biliverdin-producing heme oxygenase [Comamonas sp.]
MDTSTIETQGLSALLRSASQASHGQLDQRIMAAKPFASRQSYARFLLVQYCFHRDVAALFERPELNRLLPGLAGRQRLSAVIQDLSDLGRAPPQDLHAPVFAPGAAVDLAMALGWLYVEEGSNLGAAFLLKAAAALELNAEFGARHLAPHAQGRALSWKAFSAQLDAVPLDPVARGRAAEAAQAAFLTVHGYVQTHCELHV